MRCAHYCLSVWTKPRFGVASHRKLRRIRSLSGSTPQKIFRSLGEASPQLLPAPAALGSSKPEIGRSAAGRLSVMPPCDAALLALGGRTPWSPAPTSGKPVDGRPLRFAAFSVTAAKAGQELRGGEEMTPSTEAASSQLGSSPSSRVEELIPVELPDGSARSRRAGDGSSLASSSDFRKPTLRVSHGCWRRRDRCAEPPGQVEPTQKVTACGRSRRKPATFDDGWRLPGRPRSVACGGEDAFMPQPA